MTAYAEQLSSRWVPLAMAGSAVLLGALAGYEPRMALAMAFGLVFVAVALVSLTAGTCLLAMLTFVDEVVPSGGLPLTKIMGALLILSWLASISVGSHRREKLFESSGFVYLLLVFILWAGLSALWAENPGDAISAVTRYAPNAMLFLIVFAAANTRSRALWVVGAFVLGTIASAAYGVAFPVPADVEGRLSGALGNANETATALAVGVALAGGLAFALRGQPWLRAGVAVGIPLCLAALFLTVSRGGLVALGAVLVAGVLVAGPRRKAAVALVAVAAVGAVAYFGVIAEPQMRERLFESDGGTGRSDIWTVGWRIVEANPVVGVGAGNFASTSVHYLFEPGVILRPDFIVDDPKVAHNTYLEVLAELGVVGLLLFLAILGYVLRAALAAARGFAAAGDRGMEMVARAVLVALIGFMVAAFFGSREFSNQLWLLLSLAPALLGVARAELARQGDGQVAEGRSMPRTRPAA